MGGRAIIAGGGTGGHLYPAIVLAEAIERRSGGEVTTMLIGARRGIEARVLPERGVAHELLPLEPIYRSRVWRNWRLVPAAARAAFALRRVFASVRPGLVVGTGGYAAGPVVAWGVLAGIRTAIQEQNSYPGLVTRLLAPWVDQVHLAYPEAVGRLSTGPETRVRTHGNPIRWSPEVPDPETARRALGVEGERIVLVVGGSQGAAPLNEALAAALEAVGRGRLEPLPGDVTLLWATGPKHHESVTRRLGGGFAGGGARIVPFIDEMEMALSVAALAVSRAGALALSELCAWGVPMLLVPFPHAAGDHQRWNARTLADAGAARVIEQARLEDDPAVLWTALRAALEDEDRLERMRVSARARGRPEAADRIAEDLLSLMGEG